MQRHFKFSIWYVVLGVWIVLILQHLLISFFEIKTIPYSEFIRLLENGDVEEIAVSRDLIEGKLKEKSGTGDQPRYFRTVRVDPELSEMLKKYDLSFAGRIESDFLPALLSWVVPVLLFFGIWFFVMRRMMGAQQGFMTLGKNRAKIYVESDLKVSFKDVAGVDEAKQELVEVVDFLKTPEKFTRIGGKLPKGVLLIGPPGTGKTLLARAVAGESGVPFYSLSGSEFVEMFVGVGAARVRELFEQAKKNAPCIIFVDELDALGRARGSLPIGGHDEREQTLNQLLVEMDGFDPTSGVVLIAATNRPEILDQALLRPGRFDRQILVDRPDKKGREEILKVHLRNVSLAGNVDVEKLAAMTPGMVGADLANLVNEAALLAVRKNSEEVGMADFEEAVERIVAGLEKKNRLINEKERKIVAYHEMGHALVALSLPGTDPVRKISIIPRGIAALGYTMQVPTEDRFLMSRTELLNRIATLLGGRAAEKMIFDDVSTGAHNDLAKATEIARSMVKEYGMGESVGQVYFAREKRNRFLADLTPDDAGFYSEATAEKIDMEVQQIIDSEFVRALDILREKRDVLEKGAEILLENEKIEGDEIQEILGKKKSDPEQLT